MNVVRAHHFLINMTLNILWVLVILVAVSPCDIAGDVQVAHTR
jgi:hypothetical protein